tara:strand:+ start:464 stop:1036 length:573 start_codon:yes stop_codon:yes gene_type:complete
MKVSMLKNVLLIIITPLMLFFWYSIYEKPDNVISDDVFYNVRCIAKNYQVIHTSKLHGTNYSILIEFDSIKLDIIEKYNYVDSINFKLTNFGGPIHLKIDSVAVVENNNFEIYISKSFFKSEKTPYLLKDFPNKDNRKLRIDIDYSERDSHIKVKNFLGNDYQDERELLGINKEGEKYCCGRRCKFQYTE